MAKKLYYQRFLDKLQRCINLERQAEKELYFQELKSLTGEERQRKGRTLLHLLPKFLGRGLAGRWIWRFSRKNFQPLPEHQMKVGDLVLCSEGKPDLYLDPVGTITEVSKFHVIVAFEEDEPYRKRKGFTRLDLVSNETTFLRMQEAIEKIRKGKNQAQILRNILFGYTKAKFDKPPARIEWANPQLNSSQKEAVKKSLSAQHFHLIHGPPGTGKTTTCVELIIQLVRRGEKVLACADSNTAVDNLVEGLSRYPEIQVVRLGHPARVSPLLLSFSLDFLVENQPDFEKVKALRDKIATLREEREKYQKPSPSWRRGLTDKEIQKYARKQIGARGLSSSQMLQLSRWISLNRHIQALRQRANELENNIIDEILNSALVICATNSTAGSEILSAQEFDAVVIDEATQATEPSCYIPLIRGKRFFLAGDHKQLPPTILSMDAQREGLAYTLFERLLDLYAQIPAYSLLQVQYRMNERLLAFPSETFYEGKVQTAEIVRNIELGDLLIKRPYRISPLEQAVLSSEPVVFIDTQGLFPEFQAFGSTSRENIAEAQLLLKFADLLINYGVSPRQMGIIAPYKDQVEWMRLNNIAEGLEIHTVDGFQGREKEVILLSFVRSNPQQEIGFLMDERRLNVSLTRAKRKLVMMGDAETLSSSFIFASLLDFVRQNGVFLSLQKEWTAVNVK